MSSMERRCIKSWKEKCPEYEIKLWNEDNFDIEYCEFTKIAYQERKYAFVSDVARIYALYTEGGMYLDTDMLLLTELPDSILNLDFFIGKESKVLYNAAILGSSKGSVILKDVLDYYLNSNYFVFRDQLIPNIITKKLLNYVEGVDFVSFLPDYFYPLPYQLRKFHYKKFLTNNSLAVHLWSLSWKDHPSLSLNERILRYLKYYLSYFYIPKSFEDYTKKSFY